MYFRVRRPPAARGGRTLSWRDRMLESGRALHRTTGSIRLPEKDMNSSAPARADRQRSAAAIVRMVGALAACVVWIFLFAEPGRAPSLTVDCRSDGGWCAEARGTLPSASSLPRYHGIADRTSPGGAQPALAPNASPTVPGQTPAAWPITPDHTIALHAGAEPRIRGPPHH